MLAAKSIMYCDLRSTLIPLTVYLVLLQHVFHATSQQIFIDKVPAYSSLTACALYPISSIVRDQMSGCGDNGAETSYACFCYSSSTAFADIISTAVVENCTQASPTPQLEASSAVKVFSSYCQLGNELGYPSATSTTTKVSATSKSSSVTRTSASATNTAVGNEANGGSSHALSTTVQICIAVIITLCVCVGVAAVFFLLRQRSKKRKANRLVSKDNEKRNEEPGSEMDAMTRPSVPANWSSNDILAAELSAKRKSRVTELPANS